MAASAVALVRASGRREALSAATPRERVQLSASVCMAAWIETGDSVRPMVRLGPVNPQSVQTDRDPPGHSQPISREPWQVRRTGMANSRQCKEETNRSAKSQSTAQHAITREQHIHGVVGPKTWKGRFLWARRWWVRVSVGSVWIWWCQGQNGGYTFGGAGRVRWREV